MNFLPIAANATTTPTLNVNGLGQVTITKSGGALAANDLTHTAIAKVIYDGTNWELQNPQTGTGAIAASTVPFSGVTSGTDANALLVSG